MLSRTEKLSLLLNELDWSGSSSFPKRKVLQKTIYILTEMGMKYDYNYGWYLHGPYSPTLANDIYEIESNRKYYNEQIEEYIFREKPLKIINQFKKLFEEKKEDANWLELVASIIFLKKHYEFEGNDLKSLLFKRKPKFSSQPELVQEAFQLIQNLTAC